MLTAFQSLWTLMNTNSVSDSFSHVITVPKSLLVWCLIFAWTLSPLGGQGSLRLMHRFNSNVEDIHGLRYWDNGPLGNLYAYERVWVNNDGAYPLSMRDIYTAGLMQSTKAKAGPLDQFGNVKIPRLPGTNISKQDSDGWFPIARGDMRPEEYTSLLGIPIIGLSELDTANVEFAIETSYVEVSCSKVEYTDDDESPGVSKAGLTITCLDCGTANTPTNRTKAFLGPPFSGLSAVERMNTSYTQPRTIKFNSTVVSGANLAYGESQADCPITQRLIEVFIECKKNDCAATKIRPSRIDHRGANFTSFDLWASVVLDMMSQASRAEQRGSQVSLGASTSELFLNNSEILPLQRANSLNTRGGGMMNLSAISADLFSARASILLNTGLQAFMCPTGFAGDFSTNLDLYGPDHQPADGLSIALNKSSWSLDDVVNLIGGVPGVVDDNIPFIAASTNATVTRHIEVYLPNYIWVVFLAISATFLFLMGLIGLVLRFATMAPNVFDPVMGLTYGNKYMSPASRQSPLDAEKRLEVLADERIRLGYVDNNEMTAKMVFGEEARICRLTKKMRYY